MRALVTTLLLLLACAWPQIAAAEPPTYRWGAGSKSGGFTKISNGVAEGLAATGDEIRLAIEHTNGSCDNVHKLLRGELDFALVQYDVAAEAFKASRAFETAIASDDEEALTSGGFMCQVTAEEAQGAQLRLLAALTDGAVHVLVRRPLRLDSFTDLGRHSIHIGKLGSGSFETAKVIGNRRVPLPPVARPPELRGARLRVLGERSPIETQSRRPGPAPNFLRGRDA